MAPAAGCGGASAFAQTHRQAEVLARVCDMPAVQRARCGDLCVGNAALTPPPLLLRAPANTPTLLVVCSGLMECCETVPTCLSALLPMPCPPHHLCQQTHTCRHTGCDPRPRVDCDPRAALLLLAPPTCTPHMCQHTCHSSRATRLVLLDTAAADSSGGAF